MKRQIKLTGMVLVSMPVGDYDRRLTILTKERGKISAFAKGARKPTNALLGCSQPFAFGEFLLHEGKDSYHVISADIHNYFGELREDMQSIYYAMYFCEFSCHMTKENLEAGEPLKLLYMTLRALSKPALDKRLVRRIFELRFMALNGEMPQVDACVVCNKEEMFKEVKGWFSAAAGGICCESCRRQRLQEMQKMPAESLKTMVNADGVWLTTSTIYTMQYILATPLEKLYTFAVSGEVLKELSKAMEQFLARYVGCNMKSEEWLDLSGKK